MWYIKDNGHNFVCFTFSPVLPLAEVERSLRVWNTYCGLDHHEALGRYFLNSLDHFILVNYAGNSVESLLARDIIGVSSVSPQGSVIAFSNMSP